MIDHNHENQNHIGWFNLTFTPIVTFTKYEKINKIRPIQKKISFKHVINSLLLCFKEYGLNSQQELLSPISNQLKPFP